MGTAPGRTHRRSLFTLLAGDAVRFREKLEQLGPTFVKIGQFLALRPDIVPEEYCDELMRLLDRVPPFPWEQARQILEQELESDPSYLFSSFDPDPFAAASLAQVHAARLKDGTEVAVKIQRPHLQERVQKDLRRARMLARLWELSGSPFLVPPSDVVEELGQWLHQEIDFRNELSNLARMYDLMAGSTFERVPRPYPGLSTRRVLTTELLRGIPVSEVLSAQRSRRDAGADVLDDLDADKFATNLIYSTLRQVFRFEFFHADLHPGNLLILPDGAVGFVDFGLCDELDETIGEQQGRFLFALYSRDIERMYSALSEIVIPGERTDMQAFHRDFIAESHVWLGATRASPTRRRRGLAADRSPIANAMLRVMELARKHELQIPARVLSMYRSLLGAETVATRLAARANLRSVGRRFFRETQIQALFAALKPRNLEPLLLNSLHFLRESPGQLQRVLNDLAEGRLVIQVSSSSTPADRRLSNQRARLVTTSILCVAVGLLLFVPAPSTVLGIPLRAATWVVLVLLYAAVLVQWRALK